MPSTEQLEGIRAQVEGLTDDELAGARWAIHPRDPEALRGAVGDVERALGLWQIITADPDLEGRGPRLVWEPID